MIKNYSKTGDDKKLQYDYRMIKYYIVAAGLSRITAKRETI
jgi:hypothetical protein